MTTAAADVGACSIERCAGGGPRKMASVVDFYDGKSVFLTGATGFLGKVFIEKMLRSCPGLRRIYCLVRSKRGKSGTQRLTDMFKLQFFEKLRAEVPLFEDKVIAVEGDIMENELGISDTDLERIREDVNLIVHSAATVKFDEPLRVAVPMNILSVRKMITLARKLKDLKAFIHVSTAFANCDREHIEEIIYKPDIDYNKLIELVEWMNEDIVNSITSKLIGDKPNTYTFTKQMAEYLISQEAADIPVAIVRPSIVTSSLKDPFPGWTDSFNGPASLWIPVAKGLLRTILVKDKTVADVIPVDFTINVIIAIGWFTATQDPDNCKVYQITSGSSNPLFWKDFGRYALDALNKTPFENAFRRPNTAVFETNKVRHSLRSVLDETIPAHLADSVLRLIGKRPFLVHIYKKIHTALNQLQFFTVRQWVWTNSNLSLVQHNMEVADTEQFFWDAKEIHWPKYTEDFVLGIKKFILKENPGNIDAANAKLRKLRNIRYLFNTVLLFAFIRLFIGRSQIAHHMWLFVMRRLLAIFKFLGIAKSH